MLFVRRVLTLVSTPFPFRIRRALTPAPGVILVAWVVVSVPIIGSTIVVIWTIIIAR